MKFRKDVIILVVLVAVASLQRVVFYSHNLYFSPVIALALFGGGCLQDRKYSFALPLLAMFCSDLIFEIFNIAPGFWGWGQLISYLALVLITVIGFYLRKPNAFKVVGASVSASILFFLISNSAVWIFDASYYAPDFSGWVDCMLAGIPFLKNSMLADLSYSGLLFGAYYFIFQAKQERAVKGL